VQWLEKRAASSVKMTATVVTTVVLGRRTQGKVSMECS
jgi:hypothetical protein